MKLVKNLLLGSAAGLIVIAAAQAADLPVKKAAPIEFVRVCSAYGAGFFYIPGTDTCLRVSGRARFEAGVVGSNYQRGSDLANYRGAMRLNVDARTQTAYGTLRAFTRLDVQSRTGNFVTSGSQQRLGNAFPALGPDTFGRAQQYVNVDKAFVQFAGLTAGRASSFFDFYAHDFEIMAIPWARTWPPRTCSPIRRSSARAGRPRSRWKTRPSAGSRSSRRSRTRPRRIRPSASSRTAPRWRQSPTRFNAAGLPTSGVYFDVTQKNRTPDFVGALRLDQAWGSAQLSAAVHEVGIGQPTGTIFGLNGGAASLAAVRRPSNEYGWAVQGGLKVNLPFIAPGDALYLQGAYGEGAMSYTGFQAYTATWIQSSTLNQNSPFVQYFNDAVDQPDHGQDRPLDELHGRRLVPALLVARVALGHLRQLRRGPVQQVRPRRAQRLEPAIGGNVPPSFLTNPSGYALSPVLRDVNQIVTGASLIWSPVKDLDIGVEGLYTRVGLLQGRTRT